MTGDSYHCPTHEVVSGEDTYEVTGPRTTSPWRRCTICAEDGIDQVVNLIADEDVDLGIVDYLV